MQTLFDKEAPAAQPTPAPAPVYHQTPRVVVADIEMNFGSMVVFMIKWAFAAIPALVIIGAIFVAIAFAFALLTGALNAIGGSAGGVPGK